MTLDGSNSSEHQDGAAPPSCAELSKNDQRMLDALVECGFDTEALDGLTEAERERAEALENLFGLLQDYPVEEPDETLIHATLARIDRYEDAQAERMALASAESESTMNRWRFGVRMPDLIAVAAAILLVASVVLPVMHSMRQRSLDLACAQNLRSVAFAFSNYAADNLGMMPVTHAATLGGSWDHVFNAVNLRPLLEDQYCSRGHLNCPGNHDNLEMGYSYQWQHPEKRMVWGGARITIAMGDRNPIMDAARAGRAVHHLAMSPDHGGRGQNVLATDGHTMWLGDEPIVGRADNIWLPHGARELIPGARPRDLWDVFLAH